MLNRRKLITGLISFAAAPAIVRASSLMPVKVMDSFDPKEAWDKLMSEMLSQINPYWQSEYSRIIFKADNVILKITGIDTIKDFYIDNTRTVSER